jgi:hypothetical protein
VGESRRETSAAFPVVSLLTPVACEDLGGERGFGEESTE